MLHPRFHRLDDDDRVVDDDADRQHDREQRDRIGGIIDGFSTMKVPIRLTGTAIVGISVARKLPRNR